VIGRARWPGPGQPRLVAPAQDKVVLDQVERRLKAVFGGDIGY
jgi:hypothetical protein